MKKLLITALSAGLLFSANSEDINQKLDLLIQKINQLEKKVDQKDEEIDRLKKELKEQKKSIKQEDKNIEKKVKEQLAVKSCKKIGVKNLTYKYFDEIIPYYILDFDLINQYPKKIVFLEGNLFAEDDDGVKILQAFVKRKVSIEPGTSVHIHMKHLIDNDLEKYLKDSDPKKLHIYFEVIKAKFADGKYLECGL